MFFFYLYYIMSREEFTINSNSINSLTLYFGPYHSIKVDVNGSFKTFLSDLTKAKGLTIEINANNILMMGPFDDQSHLDGIDFYTDFNYTNYNLYFQNDNDNDVALAIVFSNDLNLAFNIITNNFSNFYFPISNYQSKKLTFYYNNGLIFHEKKYSSLFIILISISQGIVFIFLLICSSSCVVDHYHKIYFFKECKASK